MQLTDMHNSVVLPALLGLVIFLSVLKTQNLQNDGIITQIIGTMSLFHLEEYKLVKRKKCIGSEKKIYQCEVWTFMMCLWSGHS